MERRVREERCGRSDEGQYGRTVEAIEQPISAPAASQVGEPVRMWFVCDMRRRARLLVSLFWPDPGSHTELGRENGVPIKMTGHARVVHLPCSCACMRVDLLMSPTH